MIRIIYKGGVLIATSRVFVNVIGTRCVCVWVFVRDRWVGVKRVAEVSAWHAFGRQKLMVCLFFIRKNDEEMLRGIKFYTIFVI